MREIKARTCGTCEFSKAFPEDFTKRICKGAPPTPIAINVPGRVMIQYMFPVVGSVDEGCGVYKPRIIIDDAECSTLKQSDQ